MTRNQIIAESWSHDERLPHPSRTERRCRAVLGDLDWNFHWIGKGHPTGSRVAVENVAAGTANAIARAATKHGSPLGGSRGQRRAARTRRVQGSRRYRRETEGQPCPF